MNCNLSIWDRERGEWLGGEIAGRPIQVFPGYREVLAVKEGFGKEWDHEIYDGYKNLLPHFFSATGWYTMRHPSGSVGGGWDTTPGRAIQAWARRREVRLTDEVNKDEPDDLVLGLLRSKKWYVMCHRGLRVTPGRVPYFDVPDEQGLYGLLNPQGGRDALWSKEDGGVWFKSMHAIWTFLGMNRVTRKGTVLVVTTGSGKWKKLSDVDPFL